MFDMTKLVKRYFELKLPNGVQLDVEPPRMKVLKKIMALSTAATNDTMDEKSLESLSDGLALALSKNKQNKKITAKEVTDMMDLDDMITLITVYFEWVGEIQGSKN